MALTGALKDQARILSQESTRNKVEGKTILLSGVASPWFRARLSPTGGQRVKANDGTWKVVRSPSLLFGKRDTEGNSMIADGGGCVLQAKDRVEVDSVQLGRSVWEVTGTPEALRRKRSILGFEATLRRLDLEEFEDKI